MVRNPKRSVGSRKYRDFSSEQLQKAVEDVQSGLSLRKAEEKYGIPRCSINRAVRGKNGGKVGRPFVLNEEDQRILVSCICEAGDWGFPLTTYDIRLIVKCYLDRTGRKEPRFQDNMPGREFVMSLLQRHKALLSNKMCQNIKRSRAQVDDESINDYFNELSKTMEGVPPNLIINYDETNITDDPGRKKVVVRRGCRHPERIIDSSKSSTSVMFAGAGDGTLLPPYICYKAENLYNTWTENGPKGTAYNRSKSGWFTLEIFEDWFRKIALPYFAKFDENSKKDMIGDNLASHISPYILQECKAKNISFVLLPPNSTGITQPLDVAFFRPLKIKWRETLDEWKAKNRGTVPKDRFPFLLKQCLNGMGSDNISKNLMSGFRGAGIYPLDRQQVLKRLPSTSKVNSDREEAEISADWVSTFQEYLEESRKKETSSLRHQKKKKLTVPPGRSVTQEDLNSLSNKEKKTLNNEKKRKSKKMILSSDEDEGESGNVSEEDMICNDSSDDDLETFRAKTLERMEEEEHEDDEQVNGPTFKTINKQIGSFVVVKYEGQYYPGVIEQFDEEGATISAMTKTPKCNWKWPIKKDELYYEWDDILGGINPPKMLNKRGLFAVPELNSFV